MMIKLWKRPLNLIPVALLPLLLVLRIQHPLLRSAAQTDSFGHYRLDQLMNQINNVNRLLGVSEGKGILTTHPIVITQDGKHMLHLWCVSCQDALGNSLIESSWDADTGNLVLINHEPLRTTPHSYATLDAHKASQTAWHWMELMGVAQRSSKWSLAHTPLFVSPGWIVTWRSPDYRVIVTVDRRTHDLCRIAIKKLT